MTSATSHPLTSLKSKSTVSAKTIMALTTTAGDVVVVATRAIGVTEDKVAVVVDVVATRMVTIVKVAETTRVRTIATLTRHP